MTKVIFVPIMYQGRELKAPFLLFVDWTVEQRKRYANDLRELKKLIEFRKKYAWQPSIAAAADVAESEGTISKETKSTLSETISSDEHTVFCFRYEKGLEDLWLDMQIGMVDVPTFEF